MKDLTKLKELVLAKVPMAKVLQSYDVEFMYNPDLADEVQFRCPIHGTDNKPSARYYRETQTCYCWVCQKRWDAISFTRDKENLNYAGAILYLIKRYKLDTSAIPDTPELRPVKTAIFNKKELQDESSIISLKGKIREFKGKLPLEKYSAICSAYFMIMFDRYKGIDYIQNIKKMELKLEGLKSAKKN